jgi:hypothetical protein
MYRRLWRWTSLQSRKDLQMTWQWQFSHNGNYYNYSLLGCDNKCQYPHKITHHPSHNIRLRFNRKNKIAACHIHSVLRIWCQRNFS